MAVDNDSNALDRMLNEQGEVVIDEQDMEAFAPFFEQLQKRVDSVPVDRSPTGDAEPVESGTAPDVSDTATSIPQPVGTSEDAPTSNRGAQAATEGTEGEPQSGSGLSSTEAPTFSTTINDQTYTIDEPTFQRLLYIGSWADNLDPKLVKAFNAIETGEAIAIPRQELEEFRQWKESKDTPPPRKYDFDDPQVNEALADLEAELKTLRARHSGSSVPLSPYEYEPEPPSQIDDMANRMEAAALSYKDAHGLTDMEYSFLLEKVSAARVVPALVDRMTVRTPTGQIISQPDYATVINQSFDLVLPTIPELAHRVAQQQPVTSSPVAEPPRNSSSHAENVVPIKRKLAGTLSHAPTSSVSVPPKSVTEMTPQEQNAAIAEFLRSRGEAVSE